MNRHFGRATTGTGFWIHSLVQPLLESGQVELAIASATQQPECHFREGNIDHFNIAQNKYLETFDLFHATRLSRYLRKQAAIIESFKPDLIHVHGTERFFGLVRRRGLTTVPTVVSIQGLMEPYAPFTVGEMSTWDIIANTTLWELTRHANLFVEDRRRRKIQVPIEREVLMGVDAVIGRTAWDHAHARQVRPDARYFHVDEMMRPAFWNIPPWRVEDAQRGLIYTTLSESPLKGLPVLLRAISTLRRWGHDVRLTVSGMTLERHRRCFPRYVAKMIEPLGLSNVITFAGWRDAQQIASDLRQAHCFVSPSLIENSSNAICEAQLAGIPCVASHTGGTPTIVRHEQTGLLFSRSDDAMLARQIERILQDDNLASRLGAAGREAARVRHNSTSIVRDLLDCYRTLAAKAPSPTTGTPSLQAL